MSVKSITLLILYSTILPRISVSGPSTNLLSLLAGKPRRARTLQHVVNLDRDAGTLDVSAVSAGIFIVKL